MVYTEFVGLINFVRPITVLHKRKKIKGKKYVYK